MKKIVLAIHGGAGTLSSKTLTPQKKKAHIDTLRKALEIGYGILEKGGNSCDAVEEAIVSLEDSPYFNAGRGSVFTQKGGHEMDASFMDGATLKAGAVSKIASVRNPVRMARAVMDKSNYLYLSGREALDFAEKHELIFEDEEYFFEQYRYDQWLVARSTETHSIAEPLDYIPLQEKQKKNGNHGKADDDKFGTVGAVALDTQGNLAAGTSTGGLTNKRYGRVGDSAIIGAGTYANNETCAVSCTGYGEFFMRVVAAHEISSLVRYAGLSLKEACDKVILEQIGDMGGQGGAIALNRDGNVVYSFNTKGMYRAIKRSNETEDIGIFSN